MSGAVLAPGGRSIGQLNSTAEPMPRLYAYVGPPEIAERCRNSAPGTIVASAGDVIAWSRAQDGETIATFVIDEAGQLRIANRRSEHVACAQGQRVYSAGEMTFAIAAKHVEVIEVTNQSTGYCPEPDSWPSVATALERAGLVAPAEFSLQLAFRRCPACRQINVIKEDNWSCAICNTDLPATWNFD